MATDVLVNFVQRWLKQAPDALKGELLPLRQVPPFSFAFGFHAVQKGPYWPCAALLPLGLNARPGRQPPRRMFGA